VGWLVDRSSYYLEKKSQILWSTLCTFYYSIIWYNKILNLYFTVQERHLRQLYLFYLIVTQCDDGRNYWPNHVVTSGYTTIFTDLLLAKSINQHSLNKHKGMVLSKNSLNILHFALCCIVLPIYYYYYYYYSHYNIH